MGLKLGLDADVFLNSGSWATPTFAPLPNVREVTTDIDAAEAEEKNRSLTWAEYDRGLLQASVELTMSYDGADSDFQTVRDAFLNKTDLELFVADGPSGDSGTQGLRAMFRITSMSRAEPLEETMSVTFTARPALGAADKPEWHEVA